MPRPLLSEPPRSGMLVKGEVMMELRIVASALEHQTELDLRQGMCPEELRNLHALPLLRGR